MKVLFVSNGHGEMAIAAMIAEKLASLGDFQCDHLALVGAPIETQRLHPAGPNRDLPSGGLIAMGNLGNLWRDLRAGLAGLIRDQLRFLRTSRGVYRCTVAVGDVYALMMAQRTRARAVYVGTAKSVFVAPYGRIEERIINRADAIFVRDAATADRLRSRGIAAQAANAIVDMSEYHGEASPALGADPLIALFPGSREAAYDEAAFLIDVVRTAAGSYPQAAAVLSIAPGLEPQRFAATLRSTGFQVEDRNDRLEPFAIRDGERELLRAWTGSIGSLIGRAAIVLGQAGTANEAAAAAGVPVIAFESFRRGKMSWYRRRQAGLLDGAILVLHRDVQTGARALEELIRDPQRRQTMGNVGRSRMGPPGGSRRIAQAIATLAAH